MATTSPTRIDDELYASAKAAGEVMSRSAAQQIAHWARIGREVEAGSVAQRDIARVLAGAGDYDALAREDQAVVRAEWAERITALREGLDFEREFRRAGAAYSELDARGGVIRRAPAKKAAAKKPAKKAPTKKAAPNVAAKKRSA
jgi:ParD-like antitoxin of type II bacterial toxin-antitoxin system